MTSEQTSTTPPAGGEAEPATVEPDGGALPAQADRRAPYARVPRVGPMWVVVPVVGWLAVAWGLFVAVDVADVGGSRAWVASWMPAEREPYLWWHLFNDRPTEWLGWVGLALLAGTAGHLGGRLRAGADPMLPRAGRFWALLGFGAALMLIEDAGDIRHEVGRYVQDFVGGWEIAGFHFSLWVDLPLFAAMAALPVYALLRHGRYAWRSRGARAYLVAGFGLYALAGMASPVRHVGAFYERMGAWLHANVLTGLPVVDAVPESRMHFYLIDSPVEESVELLAVAALLAAALAFARDVARARVPAEGAAPPG